MRLHFLLSFIFLFTNLSCDKHSQKTSINISKNDSIPLIEISTNEDIKDEPKIKANLKIVLGDSVLFENKIGIEIRGAVSQMFYEKKSYGFELRGEDGKEVDREILGLPAGDEWILHGPYGDKTLLRNAVAYKISNSIGRYAPRTKYVELKINDIFLGSYVLMEKIKVSKKRVDIQKLSEKDTISAQINGGYLIKLDKTSGGGDDNYANYNPQNSFVSKFDDKGKTSDYSATHFLYESPKAKKINAKQAAFIKKYIADFESSLASLNFKDAKIGYQKFINVPNFIDFFILTELMQNHDGYRLSTYLQKDVDKKLQMGPIWDFDIAFGSDQGFCDGMNKHAWVYQYNKYCGSDTWIVPFWWPKLMQDPDFKSSLISRWKSLRSSELSNQSLTELIDAEANFITKNKMVERNFQVWDILNQQITPNSSTGSHSNEIKRMKSWLIEHAAWMDMQFLKN